MQVGRNSVGSRRAGPRSTLAVLLCAVAAGATIGLPVAGASSSSKGTKAAAEAKGDLIKVSDLGAGWSKTTATTTGTTGTGTTGTTPIPEIATCEGITISKAGTTETGDAQAQFTNTKAVEFAFEFVGVFPSTKTASAAFKLFSNSKAPTCVGPLFADEIAQSATTVTITPTQIETTHLSEPPVGTQSTALKLTIPFTAGGTAVSLDVDLVIIRHGKVLALVAPIGLSGRLTAKFVRTLVGRAASRLR